MKSYDGIVIDYGVLATRIGGSAHYVEELIISRNDAYAARALCDPLAVRLGTPRARLDAAAYWIKKAMDDGVAIGRQQSRGRVGRFFDMFKW